MAADDRLVILDGVPVFCLRFPVAVLRIRATDLVHKIVTVRRHRQIGDGCVPHRFGEFSRVIPAVLKEWTLIHHFPRTALAHQSNFVIRLRRLRLRRCSCRRSKRFKVCRVMPCQRSRYDFTQRTLRCLEIRSPRQTEKPDAVGNMVEYPAVVVIGQLYRIRFKSVEKALDAGTVGYVAYSIGLPENPVSWIVLIWL